MLWTSPTLLYLPAPLLALLPALCCAFPQFTSPSAGASLDLPTLIASWQDSGTQPLLSELTAYTVQLMVGGNSNDTMGVLQTFTSDGLFQNAGTSASGNISAGIAGPLTNGFFFQIVSTTDHDTQIINYSDRFSITGLTGTNPPTYINAVTALHGSTKGPSMRRPDGYHSSAVPSQTPSVHSTKVATPSPTSTDAEGSLAKSSTAPAVSSQRPSGLSTGADVAIGVIFGLGGLVSIIVAAFYYRRRIRQQKVDSITDVYDPMAKPELSGESRKRTTRFGFSELVEADHGQPLSEMDSINTKFELEGDTPPIAEASSGRLSVSSDAFSTECGTMTSSGSETLAPGTPRPGYF